MPHMHVARYHQTEATPRSNQDQASPMAPAASVQYLTWYCQPETRLALQAKGQGRFIEASGLGQRHLLDVEGQDTT